MSYHTIIFAPDTLHPDEGPMVQMPGNGLPPADYQSTLPVPESNAVLFDAKGNGIYFDHLVPKRRRIGFVR